MPMISKTVIFRKHGSELTRIETGDSAMIDRLRFLSRMYPDKVTIEYTAGDQTLITHLPFSWVGLAPDMEG